MVIRCCGSDSQWHRNCPSHSSGGEPSESLAPSLKGGLYIVPIVAGDGVVCGGAREHGP
jgi:hypothetical protein